MTIEILETDKPIVIEKTPIDWVLTAMLFTGPGRNVGPDQTKCLSSDGDRTCVLKTSQNPDSSQSDTVGQIEIWQNNHVVNTIDINQDTPIFVIGDEVDSTCIAVTQIVRYRHFS